LSPVGRSKYFERPFHWPIAGGNGAALRHPLLLIRRDKPSVFHLVRNCGATGSLYRALQPPDRFIDPVFLALGLSPRFFTTHGGQSYTRCFAVHGSPSFSCGPGDVSHLLRRAVR
jgi:hypothetical protein